jgi:hypothetical protein
VPIYSTLGSFPSTAVQGALGVAADTGILYEWNGTSWVPIASASSYGASTNYAMTYGLGGVDVLNKYVTLPTIPTSPINAQLTVLGGILQTYGLDFTISGNILSWSGTDLDGFLTVGDTLFVFYW